MNQPRSASTAVLDTFYDLPPAGRAVMIVIGLKFGCLGLFMLVWLTGAVALMIPWLLVFGAAGLQHIGG